MDVVHAEEMMVYHELEDEGDVRLMGLEHLVQDHARHQQIGQPETDSTANIRARNKGWGFGRTSCPSKVESGYQSENV